MHGPGGMTPQVAAYQQILNLLPAIGGPQLLSLRQVLHDAHGQVGNLPENFGGNVSQPCMGVPLFGLFFFLNHAALVITTVAVT